MRRASITALLFAVLAASSLMGCGSESESTAPAPGSAQRQAMETIAAFFGADPVKTCGSLSMAALDRLGGAERCRKAARGRKAIHYEVDSVRVDGDSAVAVVRSAGRVIQFTLIDENGAWRVTEPLPALPGIPSSVPR